MSSKRPDRVLRERRGMNLLIPVIFFVILFVGVKTEPAYYRAAVLEHVRFIDTSYPPQEIVQKNLDVYEIAAKTAAAENADIIVFPEWGLFPHFRENRTFLYNFGEDVPDPKTTRANPCNQSEEFSDRPALTRLSCLARDNGLFLVANLLDRKNCSGTSDTCDAHGIDANCGCPEDGQYFFNTNVVFDREGTLVARYYKRHLYFEFDLNPHPRPEDVFFETDFGNFTTVICFDLMFRESVSAVEGVVNVAYPTFWYDHVPLVFFATPYQQAWAIANKVNLLAANVHFKGTGTLGSGIYSGDQGALIYTHNPDDRHKILISNVPTGVRVEDNGTVPLPTNAKRFAIENGQAVQVDIEEDRDFEETCGANVVGEANETFGSYRCHPSGVDHYDFVRLEEREGTVEMCSNGFCCSVEYEADSLDESYYFAVTGKNLNFYDTFTYGVQGCFLSRCDSFNGQPCTNYILKSSTVFRKLEMKGNFTTKNIFPFAVDSHVRLTDRKYWSYDRESTITYANPDSNSSLLFIGLYGRIFDLDGMIVK